MSARVLLIYPPSGRVLREDRCMVPAKNPVMSPSLPPTDLLSLAAVAEAAGCVCRVEDYSEDCRSDGRLRADLRSFMPDFLLISTTTPTLSEDLQVCALAKQLVPGVVIIAKGSYFLRFGAETLARFPDLDLVVRGEAEITFQEVVRGMDLGSIAGLIWRDGDRIVRNHDRPLIEDLDELPFPARHLIDNSRYIRPDSGRTQAVIKVSRGCPYHCFFCLATPVSGSRVRMRSPANIIAELADCRERYGIREYLFWSDIFTFDRSWVLDLCGSIERAALGINWSSNVKADRIDRDLAQAMKRAGCTLVSVGVESGSQVILDRIGKGMTLDQVRSAFQVLREAGLTTLAYYQVGLPWETRETLEETIRFAQELDSDYASFFASTPFPGTRFFEYALEQGLFLPGYGGGAGSFRDAYYAPAVRGHSLTREEIAPLRDAAVRRFYARPGYVLKCVRKIRSWGDLVRYARAARSLIWAE